jgi:hypothetical protein
MLFALIALADERQLLHVEAGLVQRTNGLLCFDVCVEYISWRFERFHVLS